MQEMQESMMQMQNGTVDSPASQTHISSSKRSMKVWSQNVENVTFSCVVEEKEPCGICHENSKKIGRAKCARK